MGVIDVINFADAILRRKDPYNHHGFNVSFTCMKIAKQLSLSKLEMRNLYYSARLHDVGKILLTDQLLNETRKLTSGEYERIKIHVLSGYEILKELKYSDDILDGIQYHQEHYDGSGYPYRLRGQEIPLFARIICIADVWEAITHERAYKKAMNKEIAIAEMKKCSSWFDPNLLQIFLEKVI